MLHSFMSKGLLFNIQRYSVQDGPGIRTTVFFKGCPLRCTWCSNPESQKSSVEVAHNDALCTQCGLCIEVCDVGAISLSEKGIKIDRALCTNCMKCIDVCPFGALKVFGQEISVAEVLREVRRDYAYYRNSGGGVTISGGEPLSQANFAIAFSKACQDVGLHVTLDTCGYCQPDILGKIVPHVQLVLYDIKHMDPVTHSTLTGVSNKLIFSNLRLLMKKQIPTIIRVVIVPGLNDGEDNIIALADLVRDLKYVKRIDLLPYHRFGASKYSMLDRQYELDGLRPPTVQQLQSIRESIQNLGVACEIQR